jgi:hypothetical protein
MPTWGVAPFDPPLKQNVVHDLLASSNWLDQFFARQYSRQTNFPTLQSLSSLALPILGCRTKPQTNDLSNICLDTK